MADRDIIGITGGIGSGKSVVSRILRLNGFMVYDCDHEAKRLMVEDYGLRQGIRGLLGDGAYLADGTVDNKFVATRIFNDPDLLAGMNALVHRVVKDDFLRQSEMSGAGIVFCESAILASSGLSRLCSSVWLVTAPSEVRLSRVMKRNGLCEAEVVSRMEAQKGEERMLGHQNVEIIPNDGESLLLPRVLKLLNSDIINTYVCSEKF